jgi:ectoine hydroxylase
MLSGGIVSETGPAGSAVLVDCNTMHGSVSNITPWSRCNVFIVFNSVENALVQPFSGQPPRPRHIASRSFTALSAS